MAVLIFDTQKEKFTVSWDYKTEDFVNAAEKLVALCTGKYNKEVKEAILNFGISSLNGDVERAQLILEMFNAYISSSPNSINMFDDASFEEESESEEDDDVNSALIPPEQSFDGIKE